MMAGGIRPTRNAFRGVKKDMLQRQTTLYLQNMTVSFLHKKSFYFEIESSVFYDHYVNLRVLYETWNFYTVWETYRLLQKDAAP